MELPLKTQVEGVIATIENLDEDLKAIDERLHKLRKLHCKQQKVMDDIAAEIQEMWKRLLEP